MNRIKQITAVLLAASILSGCAEASSQTESLPASAASEVQTVPKETPAEENIHDNDALYENRDLTSVTNMYLTVSTGNEADSSNHTWEEINSHSTYYYDDLGVERYKVEGILQIDDGNGLGEGSYGYGETVPNVTVQVRGQTSSVGGEITSQPDPETLFHEGLSDLLNQVEDCHLTFIGPHCPDSEDYPSAYEAIQRRIGYKYYISRLSTTFSFSDNTLEVQLDWENAGAAPLYWDWPVMIKIFDSENNLVYWETLNLKLSQLVPGEKITTTTNVPYLDSIRDRLSIGITIASYDGKDNVDLAMDVEMLDDSQIIYTFERE